VAAYRFEPPAGHTHAGVLLEAHRIRVARDDHHIGQGAPGGRDRGARDAPARFALRRPLAEGGIPVTLTDTDALRALQGTLDRV